ncbi:hypothetical protein [Streptomyces tropicalis]|uniref:Uncharacterized protein n=1 Tax=Streptomyces tropicalis TaxID=3034234 RepID=A0ABT6A1T1_9ACTN|nr:hypothetical protein [Streptomyces tropicalis]MDF3298606.1 hypothetical protein [Streptomyces tropicalis]
MTRPPTAAQQRLVDAADPVTGRLGGTPAQLAALVRRGLAFRHPRPPHDHFLTPAGHRTREAPAAGPAVPAAGPDRTPAPAGATGPAGASGAVAATGASAAPGVFSARVGGEPESGAGGPARAREVHSAWQGLLELRRMTGAHGAVDRPCGWERSHLVQAAALALEAGGHPPAGPDTDGYRVRATPQPEAVAVYGTEGGAGPAGWAATLERAGWQVGEHAEPRTGRRYLLASPRRA